jgi:hypothetical protein
MTGYCSRRLPREVTEILNVAVTVNIFPVSLYLFQRFLYTNSFCSVDEYFDHNWNAFVLWFVVLRTAFVGLIFNSICCVWNCMGFAIDSCGW